MNKLFIIILLFVSSVSYSAEQVKVVSCNDGDTCKVLTAKNKTKSVRIADIDSPEYSHFGWGNQPHREEARKAIIELCVGETATLISSRKEKYGRTYGKLICKGQDASTYMVATGNAWRYHFSRNKLMLETHKKAQAEKIGLWSKDNPIDPYLWRKNKLK